MEHIVKIKNIAPVTHDVNRYTCTRPQDYKFKPGQATEVSINQEGWKDKKRPFTFTCLPDSENLEFTIKSYRDHDGVTKKLDTLEPGDELILRDTWGAIQYKGRGYFIAGGAGITPFIAILRELQKENQLKGNKLFFSNKTDDDIILENELRVLLGDDAEFIITDQDSSKNTKGYLDEDFLREHIKDTSQNFYVCGPEKMIESVKKSLKNIGASAESVVFEK